MMRRTSFRQLSLSQVGLLLCLTILSTTVFAQGFEWKNLWSTPEQRAQRQLRNEQYNELLEQAPNADWRGAGEYRSGDFSAAAKSFAQQKAQAEQAGLMDEAIRSGYNQANAHVKNGEYQQAINLYEDVLSQEPEHQNAEHNLNIANQLLQQQQSENQQGSEGEDSENQQDQQDQQSGDGESESSEDSGDGQEGEQESDEAQQQNGEPSEDESESSSGSNSDSESEDAIEDQSEEEQAAQAAEAMQAEQERQAAEQQLNQAGAESEQAVEAPLTEREQANEQWLRQIPDDPAGLLERKIQNRHQTDFPKVQDSDNPW